ncbi:hypothetical protein G210_1280 [Candida maltosa Xu316]|uniref:Uncharacterized protein n=1 Tax=Candida maltosa (strain Xu316) TaxID=1245528 RepID=M3HT18_CANMX|nr:hypothetical protein G210_1280 [Candida maltosa Xu316]
MISLTVPDIDKNSLFLLATNLCFGCNWSRILMVSSGAVTARETAPDIEPAINASTGVTLEPLRK